MNRRSACGLWRGGLDLTLRKGAVQSAPHICVSLVLQKVSLNGKKTSGVRELECGEQRKKPAYPSKESWKGNSRAKSRRKLLRNGKHLS